MYLTKSLNIHEIVMNDVAARTNMPRLWINTFQTCSCSMEPNKPKRSENFETVNMYRKYILYSMSLVGCQYMLAVAVTFLTITSVQKSKYMLPPCRSYLAWPLAVDPSAKNSMILDKT